MKEKIQIELSEFELLYKIYYYTRKMFKYKYDKDAKKKLKDFIESYEKNFDIGALKPILNEKR